LRRLRGADVALAELGALVRLVARAAVERLEMRVDEAELLLAVLDVDGGPASRDGQGGDAPRDRLLEQRVVGAAGRVRGLDPAALPDEDRVAHRQALVVVRAERRGVPDDRGLEVELVLLDGDLVLELLALAIQRVDEVGEEVTALGIRRRRL